jgi:hypothetical protein
MGNSPNPKTVAIKAEGDVTIVRSLMLSVAEMVRGGKWRPSRF